MRAYPFGIRLAKAAIGQGQYAAFMVFFMNKRMASLDIGTVRIGVAISNPEGTVALAHSTVQMKGGPDPMEEIARILTENEIEKVVVGWPLELDGSEGPAIRRTKQFLVRLKKVCPGIKLIPQDERLTSSAAENALQEMEMRGSQKKSVVDSMAATLILQMYLDRREKTTSKTTK